MTTTNKFTSRWPGTRTLELLLIFSEHETCMINPETVRKLKLLHELALQSGSFEDLVKVNFIIEKFDKNETLSHRDLRQANKIYKKLKRL